MKSSKMKTKGDLSRMGRMGRIDLEMVRRKLVGLVEKKFGDGERWKNNNKGKMEMDGKYSRFIKDCLAEFNTD